MFATFAGSARALRGKRAGPDRRTRLALVVGAKLVRDLAQVWQHRRRVGARFGTTLPLALAFEAVLFLGGLAALLKLLACRSRDGAARVMGRAVPAWRPARSRHSSA